MASANGPRVLIVDDGDEMAALIERVGRADGWRVERVPGVDEAIERLDRGGRLGSVALVDLDRVDRAGLAVMSDLRRRRPGLPVVLLGTGQGTETVVEAIRAGAADFIAKPFEPADLRRRIGRAVARGAQVGPATDEPLEDLMGPSDCVRRLAGSVAQVAPTRLSVLLEGESGTGKELLARRIHALSDRADGPFVAIDCGAIPDGLVESELFGFRRGSFTGADADRTGRLVAATGGTLFLDEVGNLTPAAQAKLLRVLQERAVVPVGATASTAIDVRVLGASNVSLAAEIEAGRFRLDLYHRLAEFPIRIPPLRQRPEDLLHLARRFLEDAGHEFGKAPSGFTEGALRSLLDHPWPGNVRELRAVVRRAALVHRGPVEDLFLDPVDPGGGGGRSRSLALDRAFLLGGQVLVSREAVEREEVDYRELLAEVQRRFDRDLMTVALEQTGGNKRRIARMLGLDYKTVLKKARAL